jgi:hypothetical protein
MDWEFRRLPRVREADSSILALGQSSLYKKRLARVL